MGLDTEVEDKNVAVGFEGGQCFPDREWVAEVAAVDRHVLSALPQVLEFTTRCGTNEHVDTCTRI